MGHRVGRRLACAPLREAATPSHFLFEVLGLALLGFERLLLRRIEGFLRDDLAIEAEGGARAAAGLRRIHLLNAAPRGARRQR